MNKWNLVPLSLALLLAAPSQAEEAPADDVEARIAASQAAIQTFGSTLQAHLMTAMQEGGPLQAIEVCQQVAPDIAAEISEATGWSVGRTSLRLRNPDNAPDEWERTVLQDFERLQQAGQPAAELTRHEVLEQNGETVFRYMRAVPTAGLCLSCHGETSGDIQHALERLYPADEATGYNEGEVRGAFTVIQRM